MSNSTNARNELDRFSFSFPDGVGVLTAAFVTGLFLNIVTIITLNRCKRLVKSIKYFTINLAVSDALACVFYPSTFIFHRIDCSFTWPIFSLVYIPSTIFPVLLAIDRCIAMVFTSRYNSWISSTKIYIVCVSSWFFSFAASIPLAPILYSQTPMYSNGSMSTQCLQALVKNPYLLVIHQGFFVIMCIAMFKSCHYILRYISCLAPVSPTTGGYFCNHTSHRQKLSLAFLFIAGSFFIFRLPTMVFVTIALYGILDVEVVIALYYITAVLRMLNSLVNPFLYAWRLAECRARFLLVFCSFNHTLRSRGQQMNVRDVLGFTFEEMKNNEQAAVTQNVENNMPQHDNAHSSVVSKVENTNV